MSQINLARDESGSANIPRTVPEQPAVRMSPNVMLQQSTAKSYRQSALHCFGDHAKLLKYDIGRGMWVSIAYNALSTFKGEYKYTSVCRIAKSCDIILAGGCSILNHKASNKAFRLNTEDRNYHFTRVASLVQPRYGHAQVYLAGYVFVVGGFSHDDVPGVAPETLRACEKFAPTANKWTRCSELSTARAYAGACPFNNESIYVFGGLNGFETTNTIELYNAMLDKWTVLYVKLPLKIAKLGAVTLDRTSILIAGGIYGDTDTTY